jgi:hypothetical protein
MVHGIIVNSDFCVTCTSSTDLCNRCDAYRRIRPTGFLQRFITFVSGTPYPSQRPLIRKNPVICIAGTFAVVVVAAVSTTYCVMLTATSPWITVRIFAAFAGLIFIIMSSGEFRALHNFVLHHASHNDLGPHSWLVGELAGALAMTQTYAGYRRDHLIHHSKLTSEADPDQQILVQLGFSPGLLRRQYPRILMYAIIDPRIIFRMLIYRFMQNFAPAQRPIRTVVFVAIQAAVCAPAIWLCFAWHTLMPLLAWGVSWAIPLTLGYHVSMVIYAIGLHSWFRETSGTGWASFAEKTGARFFLTPCPRSSASRLTMFTRWIRWWFVLFLWHFLIARLFVVGLTDNGCHDAHHADPRGGRFDWCNAAYARTHYLSRLPQAQSDFWNSWSLNDSISANFDRLSAQSANSVEFEAH